MSYLPIFWSNEDLEYLKGSFTRLEVEEYKVREEEGGGSSSSSSSSSE